MSLSVTRVYHVGTVPSTCADTSLKIERHLDSGHELSSDAIIAALVELYGSGGRSQQEVSTLFWHGAHGIARKASGELMYLDGRYLAPGVSFMPPPSGVKDRSRRLRTYTFGPSLPAHGTFRPPGGMKDGSRRVPTDTFGPRLPAHGTLRLLPHAPHAPPAPPDWPFSRKDGSRRVPTGSGVVND